MYYVHNRSKVSGAKVWRSEGSERSKSGVRCSNTTEATLCATSKVRAERVRWHTGVLAQPRSHSLGGKKIVFELTTMLYVLYASCTTCVIDPRFLEPKCGGPRGPRRPRRLRGLSPGLRGLRGLSLGLRGPRGLRGLRGPRCSSPEV